MKQLPEWITQEQLFELQNSRHPADWKLHDFIVLTFSDNPPKKSVIQKKLYISRDGRIRLRRKLLALRAKHYESMDVAK